MTKANLFLNYLTLLHVHSDESVADEGTGKALGAYLSEVFDQR